MSAGQSVDAIPVDADSDVFRLRASRPPKSLIDDLKEGLLERPRSIPPKYFYDEAGSILFDRICDTDEYYPTRTESAILEANASEIMRLTDPRHVIELGSGTSRKTRHLLEGWAGGESMTYWPMDVSEEMLVRSAAELRSDFPALDVNVIVGDYTAGLSSMPNPAGRKLFVFLGGTIGNFEPDDARSFLRDVRGLMSPNDHLLIGMDRVKDKSILDAAYNDAAGLTAEFNLNVLKVLNRRAQADFDLGSFEHRARFNESRAQIEMHLVSSREQDVHLGSIDERLKLREGEAILTEISRKFTPQSIRELLANSGLSLQRRFEPVNEYFSLVLAQRPKD